MARVKEFDIQEVEEKALTLFWEKGYEGCSVNDLVQTLGLSRSSIYDTFGDKRQLYIRALDRYKKSGLEKMHESLKNTDDIYSVFEIFLNESYIKPEASEQNKGCFMVNTATELGFADEEFSKIVNSNKTEIENMFSHFIHQARQSGNIKSELSDITLARILFNTMTGLKVASRSKADSAASQDVVSATLALLK
ncbi:MAG: TetR/AcrR family transcriptional regulator [Bacteroidia bacterium]